MAYPFQDGNNAFIRMDPFEDIWWTDSSVDGALADMSSVTGGGAVADAKGGGLNADRVFCDGCSGEDRPRYTTDV